MQRYEDIRIGGFIFHAHDRAFSFEPGCRGAMSFYRATASVEMNGQAYDLSQADDMQLEEQTDADSGGHRLIATFTYEQPQARLTLTFTMPEDRSCLFIDANIANPGHERIGLNDCNLLLIDAKRGGRLPLGDHPGETVLWRYRVWESHIRAITVDGGIHDSGFVQLLHNPKDQLTFMAAFVTVGSLFTHHWIEYDEGSGSVSLYRASSRFHEYQLAPGEQRSAERLQIQAADHPYRAIERWVDGLAHTYRPKINSKTTVGWLGWAWVDMMSGREPETAVIVEGNATAIRERLAGFDIDYIWMSQVNLKDMLPGNWLNFNDEHFPQGFERTLEKLQSLQFTPGLWVAPFWVFEEADEVVREHKDMFVRLPDGTLKRKEIKWEFSASSLVPGQTNGYYVLDGTKEESLTFIRQVFSRYKELGIGYYMLDFLDDGWNNRANPEGRTVIEGARAILETIREEADNAHLLSAVGSSINYIGCFDASRVNHDYGEGRNLYPPYHAHYNATYTVNDKYFGNISSLLNNYATNYFTHRKLYINDSNVLTIDKPLPRSLAEMNATLFGLSGSSVMLGDDIRNIDEDRLAMIRKILPLTQDAMMPMDLFEHVFPDNYSRIFVLRVHKSWDDYAVVAVFNLDETTYVKELDFASFGLDSDDSCRVYDFWGEEYVGTFSDGFRTEVPPNSCKVYRISKARSHPWLLATDMHIQQGHVDIDHLEWDEERLVLRGSSTRPAGQIGNVSFVMPQNYRLINHENHWLLKDMRDLNVIIRKELKFDQPTVEWELSFAPLAYISAWH